jgi:hypothetical protein
MEGVAVSSDDLQDAKNFINDVLKINAKYGLATELSPKAYEDRIKATATAFRRIRPSAAEDRTASE